MEKQTKQRSYESGPHKHSQKVELNYCPRCGHALEDAMAFGKMRRVCPACGLVVFRDHKVAAGVAVEDEEGRLLLVKRAWKPKQGLWSLPAGFVDDDEAPEATAIRECREETGLEIERLRLLTVISGREHARGADIVIIYHARIAGGELAANDDAAEAAFFPLDDLPPLAFRATEAAVALLRERHHTDDR